MICIGCTVIHIQYSAQGPVSRNCCCIVYPTAVDARCELMPNNIVLSRKRSISTFKSSRTPTKIQGSHGVVALDNDIQFLSIRLENGDMLIGPSNSAKTIHSQALNVTCSYADR